MVLMNGSSRARNAASLINRTAQSVGSLGGVKKAGTASSVGLPASVAWVYRKYLGCMSLCTFTISTTKSCQRPVGGILRTRC